MTARFAHGLIVGKFYPPHLAHLALILDAAQRCERVTVVVGGRFDEALSLQDRVRWVSWEVAPHPHVTVVGAVDEHRIDYDDPVIWDRHERVFRDAVDEVAAGVAVDAVFSGEAYGDELARRFAATHVRTHREPRGLSGTRLRADLSAGWTDLMEAARVDLARRVVVVGAESTGTTTLAAALARHLQAAFVGEYGRSWSAAKLAGARQAAQLAGRPAPWMDALSWTGEEFMAIAQRQTAAIDAAAVRSALVVADTDALATSVWHARYAGGPHQASLALARVRAPDLYILTSPDEVAFDQDGLRDGERHRAAMHDAFVRELEAGTTRWVLVTGGAADRLAQAAGACQSRLGDFALP